MADKEEEEYDEDVEYGKQPDADDRNLYERDYDDGYNDEQDSYDKGYRQKPASTVFKSSIEFDDDEKLTDPNWEDFPWVPPSIDKAKEYRENHIFGGGRAPFWRMDLSHNQDLGIGVSLYFYFLKSFATSSFFNTILSAPNLYLAAIGNGVSKEYQDGMGLYKYTIGNIGFNRQESDYYNKSACTTEAYKHYNGTCIQGEGWELSTIEVSSILTCLEILQIFVFFCSLTFINWHADNMKEQHEKDSCSITDYTISVKNFPADVTSTDLIVHFNQWSLDGTDFQRRPKVQGALPVKNSEHTGDPIYLNTWVAEVYLHKKIGSFINIFKNKKSMTNKLYRARAQVKMYGPSTVHAKGYNEKKYRKALLQHDQLASQIATITSSALKKNKHLTIKGGFGDAITEDSIEAKVVQAFVTFEHTESFARCLEDYKKFSSFPWNWCYPEQLKMRGRLIKVHKAYEPDEIVWENLEIRQWSKRYRRSLTNIITLVWIIISFAIILQASLVKQQFKKQQTSPQAALCVSDIPLLYNLTANEALGVTAQLYPAQLLRPTVESERSRLDQLCNNIVPDTFYATWVQYQIKDNSFNNIGRYDMSACTAASALNAGYLKPGGLCPVVNETNYCPCITVDTALNSTCETAQCKNPNLMYPTTSSIGSTAKCSTFTPHVIGTCYCNTHLLRSINTIGLTGIVFNLATINNPKIEPCRSVLLNYVIGVGLSYVAVCITVMINYFLLLGLKVLTKQEAHECFDNIQASLLVKMFLSTYFNVSMIPLIAYGFITGLPSILVQISIFQGPFDDFSNAWYGNVGAYFITTFVVQAATPPAYSLFYFCIAEPYSRWMNYSAVKRKDGHTIVKQDELNKLEVGPVFDATENIAQMLLLIFLAMTYAPGEPIFMPLMCITAWLYLAVDKYLLLRYFEKPPIIGDGLIRMALNVLSYATIFRLAFACWMFGNPLILDSGIPSIPGVSASNLNGLEQVNGPSFTNAGYESWYRRQQFADYGETTGKVLTRAFKPNVIPLAALLAIIIWYKVALKVWHFLPIRWILPFLKGLCFRFEKSKVYDKDMHRNEDAIASIERFVLMELEDPLRQEAAPFSGDYFKYLGKKNEVPKGCCKRAEDNTKLSHHEEEEGYFIQTDETDQYLVKMKKFTTNMVLDGKQRVANTAKKTYEHISDHGCNSYNIFRVPAYAMIMKGLMEGVAASLDEENNKDKDNSFRRKASTKYVSSSKQVIPEPDDDDAGD